MCGIYVQCSVLFLRAVIALLFLHHVYLIQVTIALRFHLFPFRTEKLSSVTPMVLRNSGRVGSCRFLKPLYSGMGYRGFLFWYPNHTMSLPIITTSHASSHITHYLPHHITSHHTHTHRIHITCYHLTHAPTHAYTLRTTCHRIHTTIPTHTYRYLYIHTPHTTIRFATEKAHCDIVPLFFIPLP